VLTSQAYSSTSILSFAMPDLMPGTMTRTGNSTHRSIKVARPSAPPRGCDGDLAMQSPACRQPSPLEHRIRREIQSLLEVPPAISVAAHRRLADDPGKVSLLVRPIGTTRLMNGAGSTAINGRKAESKQLWLGRPTSPIKAAAHDRPDCW